MAYERWRMGTSGVSLSKPLGCLKPEASPPILFGVGEIVPSQTHNPLNLCFSSDFCHFFENNTSSVPICFVTFMKKWQSYEMSAGIVPKIVRPNQRACVDLDKQSSVSNRNNKCLNTLLWRRHGQSRSLNSPDLETWLRPPFNVSRDIQTFG